MLSIVYTSNTGYTKQYAEMVAKKLCLPIYTIKQAKKEFFAQVMFGQNLLDKS